ncbi:uncharacterized protein LOC135475263 [Liolophura sinensis]|uniref:uncharacterized protein LOC135475263 n=1 Tax=Liolophura sinensis TaxID=3198878 RepID=UPI0031587374
MFEISNTTVSANDDDGDLYHASFDFLPKKSGGSKHIFKGMLFGRGPRSGGKCAVKVKRDCYTTEAEDWQCEVNASKAANTISTVFNQRVLSKQHCKIRLRVPFTALMDTVCGSCSLVQLFSNCVGKSINDSKPEKDEFVLIEDYIRGDFSKLNSNNGWKSANSRYQELQAFAHFAWCYSGGEFVVGELQGVRTPQNYLITDPVLHSNSQLFGDRDQGQPGIEAFFQEHVCNDLCRSWAKPFQNNDPNLLETVKEMHKFGNNNNYNFFQSDTVWPPPCPVDSIAEKNLDYLTNTKWVTQNNVNSFDKETMWVASSLPYLQLQKAPQNTLTGTLWNEKICSWPKKTLRDKYSFCQINT